MTKIEHYKEILDGLADWDAFLLRESCLPGPRGNIELAQAVASQGNLELFHHYLTYTNDIAPVNSPYEFLAFCGVLGLGHFLAEGDLTLIPTLRKMASDPRWRLREAVAMALQKLGDENLDLLITEMQSWSRGSPLEQRAAAAALCEPRLLQNPNHVRQVFDVLDTITTSLQNLANPKKDDITVLRKGLGYCWSVAVAAFPEEGKERMEKWLVNTDKEIRWIMQENLKKNRLLRMDRHWVEYWRASK